MSKFQNLAKEADKKTKKIIAYFNGKVPVSDVLEMPDGRKDRKYNPSPTTKPTMNDRFFDFIEDNQVGTFVLLAITTAAVVAIMYWGIKQ